jgi:regulator of RNase E activity RraA
VPLAPDQLAALRTLSSPTVANAIETFRVRAREAGILSSEIRALFPELGPIVGYAATAVIRAERPPAEGHRASTFAWWDYLQTMPSPRIVVIHDLDEPRGQGAFWGEVQATIHMALGCVGAVTDGSVRDLDEVRALGFQLCAAHVSVSHANVHLVDFGLPVKVGGVWIAPGDLLHADQHGAVVIPPEVADRIPEAAERVAADEQRIIQVCRGGGFSLERLKAVYKAVRPDAY